MHIIYDKMTGLILGQMLGNAKNLDAYLSDLNYMVGEGGQIFDLDKKEYVNAWYEDLEIKYNEQI